jgi:acyl-CoA thioester hydrolase
VALNQSAIEGADPALYASWIDQAVRYNDVDMQGHVNNTIFPVYFEAGRLAVNRGADSPPFAAGEGLAIVQLNIRYLKPVRHDSALRVGTRVSRIGNSSWVMAQALFDAEACAALCETVMVCVNLETGASARLSDARRAYLQKFSG